MTGSCPAGSHSIAAELSYTLPRPMSLRAPLTAPGVDVVTGEYLLAVDGRGVALDVEGFAALGAG